jgi:hypothetical protein
MQRKRFAEMQIMPLVGKQEERGQRLISAVSTGELLEGEAPSASTPTHCMRIDHALLQQM